MKIYLTLLVSFMCNLLFAQKLVSSASSTMFYSTALLEDITATTDKGKSVIDLSNGEIAFSVPVSSFEFAKSLMQEHFNERYMETDKFPKASFKGVIEGWKNQTSIVDAKANGTLTIHGIAKEVEAKGSVTFKRAKLVIEAKFNIKLEDFGVEVPSIMFQKIAEVVEVTVTYEYSINEN